MKFFRIIFLVVGLALTVLQSASAQIAYEVQAIQTDIAGPKLQVDFQIRSTGATNFVLGTSTFFVNYNTSGLGTTVLRVSASDGPWSAAQDDDYGSLTTQKGTGYAGLTVVFNGGGTDDNGLVVPATWTNIGRLTINITNAALTSSFAWRAIGAVTQVMKVTSPGVYTGGGCDDITNAPSFLSLTDAPLPVELTSFSASAHGRSVTLAWATATEVKNSGFQIERKALDAKNGEWQKVAFINGHGTTNAAQSYGYTDALQVAGKYSYRLKQIDADGKFVYSKEVEAAIALQAQDYALSSNYPNPFNPTTSFHFAVKKAGNVSVTIFNMLGQEVRSLFNDVAQANVMYDLTFDGANLSSGTYFYVLKTADRFEVKKMLMMK